MTDELQINPGNYENTDGLREALRRAECVIDNLREQIAALREAAEIGLRWTVAYVENYPDGTYFDPDPRPDIDTIKKALNHD